MKPTRKGTSLALPRVFVAVLLVGSAAMLLAFWWVGSAEVKHEHYQTMAEAAEGGFDARGWMPCFMPSFATNIHESHDLDTNAQCGVFAFEEQDVSDLSRALGHFPGLALPHSCLLRQCEWSPELKSWAKGDSGSGADEFTRIRCADEGREREYGVVVDWMARKVAYWSAGS